MNSIKAAAGFAAIFTITACGGGGSGGGGGNDTRTFSLGGSVTGLSGSGLTLSSNGQTLAVAANGSFTFASAMAGGTAYNVTVTTQPSSPTQTCTVASGSGTLTSANINNVAITCGPLSPLSVIDTSPTTGAREVARNNELIVNFSIDNETDDVISPRLAFDASGNAVAIWLSYDGSVNNVRANRFE